MSRTNFERLRVYKLSEGLADAIWAIVERWPSFTKLTVGTRIVQAADSIGANIAEGVRRRSYQEHRRFIRTARGSLCETRHWLQQAFRRALLMPGETTRLKGKLDVLAPQLSAYLDSIRKVTPESRKRKGTND